MKARLSIHDKFVNCLADDVEALIGGDVSRRESIIERMLELAERQTDAVARYWTVMPRGLGIPTAAYRDPSIYHFPEIEPARVFRTSGTTDGSRGSAAYSSRGLSLLDAAILARARRDLARGKHGPQYAAIRLLPRSSDAPEVIMAYGMEKVAGDIGIPQLSDTAFEGLRLDVMKLCRLLERAVAERVPVLLMGGTFTMVNVCDAMTTEGRSFELPEGSLVLDAGGFKNRSRRVTVAEYERLVRERFGSVHCVNLFGMTELASQLYDSGPELVGPGGERVKGANPWIWPLVRDPRTLQSSEDGFGLLEVTDLAIIDRPCVVLADDIALGLPGGVAVLGRAKGAPTRGCTLHLEEMSGGTT